MNSDDLKAGRIAPKLLPNGVIVPPNLQINELTLRERHHRNRLLAERLVSREEAERVGYRREEVEAVFGAGEPS